MTWMLYAREGPATAESQRHRAVHPPSSGAAREERSRVTYPTRTLAEIARKRAN
jgi:hypothetical protein